jgi:hypothetical protein
MTVVNSKEELEQALESKETRIIVKDKKFLTVLYIVSKIQHFSSSDFLSPNLQDNVCAAVAIPPAVLKPIIITVAVCVLCATIVALLKDYNVKIKVNPRSGEVEIEYKRC